MKKLILNSVLMILLGGLLFTSLPAQCPMCKATVESSDGSSTSNKAEGLNTGILMMFALPYLTFGTLGVIFYMNYRKRRAALES